MSDLLKGVGTRSGVHLSKGLYAILLSESAAFKPAYLWATWDLAIFPISEVFDSTNGAVKPEYAFYFDTLKRIYSQIKKKENKVRIFLYDDNTTLDETKSHIGWDILKKIHKEWGFDNILCCSKSSFKGVQLSHLDAFMEDFVYFELKPFKNRWVIGMDVDTKIQSLIQDSLPVEDSRKLFMELQNKSDSEIL